MNFFRVSGQGGVTSDESQDAMRIFATSPLDRDVIMYRETGGHRPRTDSNSSASSQDRFKIGAFAGRSFNAKIFSYGLLFYHNNHNADPRVI